MKLIKQRTQDDCTVAAIATYTGLPYETVMAAAKETGYIPNSGKGAVPGEVLDQLGLDYFFRAGRVQERPCLVSVKSVNQDGRHLVVLTEEDGVLDPSNQKTVDRDHVYETVSFSYVRTAQ